MTRVYDLTIADMANFSKVEHTGLYRTRAAAEAAAERIVRDLVIRDKHHGLGDTFNVKIEEREVL